MAVRTLIQFDDKIIHQYPTKPCNKRLCIFIHGYGGNHTEKGYWGNLVEPLNFEQSIKDIDICYWKYPSSKNPCANYFKLIRRRKLVSDLEGVSQSLETAILSMHSEYEYDSIILVGHSMGGIIAVLTARRMLSTEFINIEKICLLATPKKPPKGARILSTLKGNPHLSFMSKFGEMNKIFRSIVPNLCAEGIPTTYHRYLLDEIVSYDSSIKFNHTAAFNVPHSWFKSRDNYSDAYRGIVNWLP